MLSAFVFGLALGAWLVRDMTDTTRSPLRLLGGVQIVMGLSALATLPLYLGSFGSMASLVLALSGRSDGYAVFNLTRYVLCLAVMLPATVMAGMTLPIITATLLRSGHGERSIGRVYGVNTVGSVVGAAAAGLIGLPWLGLKGLLVAGATLDVGLGFLILERSARWADRPRTFVPIGGVSVGALIAAVGLGVHLDHSLVTSGVFR